jgi:membrane-bound ClpP family serine protease
MTGPKDGHKAEMKVFGSYLLAQAPGWLLALIAVWLAYRTGAVSAWIAVALLGAFVAKDLLLFPLMRRFYQPQPARPRIVGQTGTAVSDLSPDGFVRVHGELWQARAPLPLPKGVQIRVRDIHGLIVDVDRVT